jgi:N-acetylmuramoyl-L-alanine amidase
LTRTNDTDVSLPERVALAERAAADLFLSLHFNSGTNSHPRAGLETYCLTPAGLPSNLVRNHEDDPKQTFPNNDFDDENLQWAFRLHRALLERTGAVDHGVRRARFMAVLRGQRRPAVLIEAGYLSNPREARKIATAEYRQQLAEAVAKALE